MAFNLSVPTGSMNISCAAGTPTTAENAVALSLSLLSAMERVNRELVLNLTISQSIVNGLDDAFQIKDDSYESRFIGLSDASNIYFSYMNAATSAYTTDQTPFPPCTASYACMRVHAFMPKACACAHVRACGQCAALGRNLPISLSSRRAPLCASWIAWRARALPLIAWWPHGTRPHAAHKRCLFVRLRFARARAGIAMDKLLKAKPQFGMTGSQDSYGTNTDQYILTRVAALLHSNIQSAADAIVNFGLTTADILAGQGFTEEDLYLADFQKCLLAVSCPVKALLVAAAPAPGPLCLGG